MSREQASSLDQATLHEIVAGTAAETGERFFEELVKHLARAVGTFAAWVTEWLPETRRLRALAFWADDRLLGDYEYDVRDTPCETVVDGPGVVHVPDRVLELYAGDPDIAAMGAASYLGVALRDSDGAILGHLAVLDRAPLPEDPQVLAIFDIFAGRAAAELRRLRRERDLRERERKLTSLVESAMDAILELDADLRVVGANRAAEQVFGRPRAALVGGALRDLVGKESSGKLVYLASELARQPEERQSLWIPDGLQARRADGQPFPAEATLSRFTVGARPFFETIEAIKAQPDLGRFQFRASNAWVDGGVNVSTIKGFYGAGREDDSRSEPFVFTNGEPPVLLGNNEGANPVEFLLHALAGCVTTTTVLHAAARGIKIEKIATELEGDLNVEGLLGLDDSVSPGYERIRMKMHIQADCSPEALDDLMSFAKDHSPVCNTVCRPVPVELSWTRD